MKIIIFGPTGGVGRLLVEKALAAGHSVTAFARTASSIPPRPALTIIVGSVFDAAAVEAAMAGQDSVLSALGGKPWPRRAICGPAVEVIAAAMTKQGVRRIIAISTMGAAETRADVGWLARNLLFGVVLSAEVADKEAMEQKLAAGDRDWTVVRVGRLTNGSARGDHRAADDRSIRDLGQIARADVADFMLAQLQNDMWLRRRPVIMY